MRRGKTTFDAATLPDALEWVSFYTAWLNAYSKTGASLPVNITTVIRPNLPQEATLRFARALDSYLTELTCWTNTQTQ